MSVEAAGATVARLVETKVHVQESMDRAESACRLSEERLLQLDEEKRNSQLEALAARARLEAELIRRGRNFATIGKGRRKSNWTRSRIATNIFGPK